MEPTGRSDWMLPGGSVFIQNRYKKPVGRKAPQILHEVEVDLAVHTGLSSSSSGFVSNAKARREALKAQTGGQRSRHALRRMVAEQLERDILSEFKSQEFESNPLEAPPAELPREKAGGGLALMKSESSAILASRRPPQAAGRASIETPRASILVPLSRN